MSKDLDYEFNNFANLLHKDCMNLMECLKKQSEDNKPILYLGKHYEKVILPYEEYQKMCNRLEAIDNANPSEALKCLDKLAKQIELDEDTDYWEIRNAHKTVENALLKAQEPKQYVDELKLVEKKLKALEIIKEKYPDVVEVKLCNNYEHYKLRMSSKHDTEIVKIDWNDKSLVDYLKLLTEEEFNLLKEILGC